MWGEEEEEGWRVVCQQDVEKRVVVGCGCGIGRGECWKTSPQRYHVMRLVRGTSWQESDQSDNFDRTVEVP